MKSNRIDVADIPGIYAIGHVMVDGKRYYLASSENRGGKAIAWHGSHTFDFSIGDGGSMGLVSIPGTSSVLSIEDFFPVFDAAKSIVVRTDFKVQDGCLTAKRVQFNPLPYCHRITVVSEEDGLWIVCGILCQHKAFIDDWSTPGSIMVAKLTEAPLSFIKIKDDIGKNHALYVRRNTQGYDDVFAGGSNGVFKCSYASGAWEVHKLIDNPTSEITIDDIDEDGCEEMVIVEGFHGNLVKIFRMQSGQYCEVYSMPIMFGHVLWSGRICGRMGLLVGERGGAKALTFYQFAHGVLAKICTIDEGIGPTQIFVRGNTIVVSDHEIQRVAEYEITK